MTAHRYSVTVSREFTGGLLAGLIIPQVLDMSHGQAMAYKIGESYSVKRPCCNSSPYVDTITAIEESRL